MTINILDQYADDITVILDGSEESLNEILYEREQYAKFAGLQVNFFKTHVWIDSEKHSIESIKSKWKSN